MYALTLISFPLHKHATIGPSLKHSHIDLISYSSISTKRKHGSRNSSEGIFDFKAGLPAYVYITSCAPILVAIFVRSKRQLEWSNVFTAEIGDDWVRWQETTRFVPDHFDQSRSNHNVSHKPLRVMLCVLGPGHYHVGTYHGNAQPLHAAGEE